jgi:hypothetical protein
LFAAFFSGGLHPYPSLRDSVRLKSGRSSSQLLDTDYSVATTSPRRAVSIKETLGL